jgi:hypothetical protein
MDNRHATAVGDGLPQRCLALVGFAFFPTEIELDLRADLFSNSAALDIGALHLHSPLRFRSMFSTEMK